jgi:two-component system, LytTR family, sensor kinase
MKNPYSQNQQSVNPHLFWICYWLIWVLMLSSFQELDRAIWVATVNVVLHGAVFYINIRFLIPDFFEKRKYIVFALLAFLVLFAFTKAYLTLVEPNLPTTTWGRKLRFPRAFQFGRIYLFLAVILLISTAYKFARDRFEALRRQSEVAKKQLEIELETLKNQINPHFLFNTLNNIYTLAYLKEDSAASMIMKLSELLRYMLYECQAEKVPLEREAKFLENIVEMQKLKSNVLANRLSLEIRGISSEHGIAPLLILGFVENSFKHSDLEVNQDGFIRLNLLVDDSNYIRFTCTNTKREEEKTPVESGGLGLINTRKRLELIYGVNYHLEITETTDQYQVFLKLPAYEN